jgi:uncharacterized protein YjbI with pentapeptide repeats
LADDRTLLQADCSRCSGLCCVAPGFAKSADFAIDKPAGRACPNLQPDHRCAIHTELSGRGFRGCVVFDCFGAGQQLTQVTFAGRSWRDDRATATAMFDAFTVMRQLREMQWYLVEAAALAGAGPLGAPVDRMRARLAELAAGDADALLSVDGSALRGEVGAVLEQVSAVARAEVPDRAADQRGADLVGARLVRAALRGASLRGALLIAADLRAADLRRADLLGADVRDARLDGADLTGAIFLTQPQVDAARGDLRTILPDHLRRPATWIAV